MAYTSLSVFILEGSKDRNPNRAGTWRQKLIQRPLRDATYYLVPCDLLSLISYKTQVYQYRGGTRLMRVGPSFINH